MIRQSDGATRGDRRVVARIASRSAPTRQTGAQFIRRVRNLASTSTRRTGIPRESLTAEHILRTKLQFDGRQRNGLMKISHLERLKRGGTIARDLRRFRAGADHFRERRSSHKSAALKYYPSIAARFSR